MNHFYCAFAGLLQMGVVVALYSLISPDAALFGMAFMMGYVVEQIRQKQSAT